MLRTLSTTAILLLSLTACAGSKTSVSDPIAPPSESAPDTATTSEKAMSTDDHSSHDHHKHHELGPESHGGDGPLVHRFTNPEKYAKMWESDERADWQQPEMLIKAMNIQAGDTVADIGTGTGFFLPYLSAAVGPEGKVLALDIEESMISYVEARIKSEGLTNVEASVVPMGDPNLPPHMLDAILIVNTWHHIPDRIVYAGNIAKGLSDDGGIFIIDFSQDSDLGPKKHHRLSPDDVIKEFQQAGLNARLMEVGLREQYIVRGSLTQPE